MSGAFDAGTASARLILDLKEWSANIEKAKADTTSLAGVVAAKKEDIEKLGKAFTIAGAAIVGALGMALKSTLNYTLEIGRMSVKTGIATETLSGLSEMAEKGGVSMDQLGVALKRFASVAVDAHNGSDMATKSIKALGIDINDANGKLKPMDQLLAETADKFKGMENGSEKAALAVDLFGRAGTEMIPMLNKGSEGLREYIAEQKEMGTMITAEGVVKAKAMRYSMQDLEHAFLGVKLAIGNAIIPVVKVLTDTFGFLIVNVRKALDIFPPLGNTITVVLGTVGGLLAVLGPMLLIWTRLAPVITQISALIPILNARLISLKMSLGFVAIAFTAAVLAIEAATWAIKKYSDHCDKAIADIYKTAQENKRNWEFIKDTIHGANTKIAESIQAARKRLTDMGYTTEEIGAIIYKQFNKASAVVKTVAKDIGEMATKVADVQKELSLKIAEATLNEYAFRIFQAKQYYADLKEKVRGSADESALFAKIEKAQALEITKIKKEQAEAQVTAHQAMLDKKAKADDKFLKEFYSDEKKVEKSWFQVYLGMQDVAINCMKVVATGLGVSFGQIVSQEQTVAVKTKKTFSDIAASVGQYLQVMQQGMGQFFSALSAQSEQRLKKEMARLDAEYQARKKQIEDSLMSETERAEAMDALDTEFAEKKKVLEIKQAEANKKSGIAQAIVNTAIAITSALSMKPFFPLGLIAAAMAAAAGYIQIKVIQNTALPAMAEGGLINRPTKVLAGEAGPEAILPMRELRRMLGINTKKHGAGARTVNVNISAIDTSGMEQFARRAMIPEIKRALVREELTVPPNAVR